MVVSSVFDVLEERHEQLPGTERTLRNYVAALIDEKAITIDTEHRRYRPVPQLPYGQR